MSFKENLAKEMKKAKFSQYRLSKLSNVPQPTIQRALNGSSPRSETIKKLANALGISSSVLIDGYEEIFNKQKAVNSSNSPNHDIASKITDLIVSNKTSPADMAIFKAIISRYEAK